MLVDCDTVQIAWPQINEDPMPVDTFRTMCPMNCHPTLCGMLVTVDEEKLVSITGDDTNPDSQGFLCMRGKAAHEIVGNDRRLLKPLIRKTRGTDDWSEMSWTNALDLIADRMRAVGRERVGFWQSHGNWANDYAFGLKRAQMDRFANLYGCQFWNPAMICWGLGGFGVGLTGAIETSTKEDLGANSELVILWGANTVSQANTLRLSLSDVLGMSDETDTELEALLGGVVPNARTILGDTVDNLVLEGAQKSGTIADGSGATFDIYSFSAGSDVLATLAVDADVTVSTQAAAT